MRKLLIYAIAFFCVMPYAVSADPIVRVGDGISVQDSQLLNEDFYGLGGTISISSLAKNDVYVGGGTVTINGNVEGDLTILGGVVQVNGSVGDDLRVLGGEVIVKDVIKGDLVVVGGKLTVLSSATIEGHLLFYGSELLVEGTVKKTIHGNSENIRVDAIVEGTITYSAYKSFVVGDRANVNSIYYTSVNELVRAQNAVISGDVERTTPIVTTSGFIQTYISYALVIVFAALALFLLVRNSYAQVVTTTFTEFGVSGLIGLGIFISMPLVALLLIVSTIGMLLGFIILALYLVLLLVSMSVTVFIFGKAFEQFVLRINNITFFTPLIGSCVLILLLVIPYAIGGFIIWGATVVGMGAMSMCLYRHLRS